MYRVNLSCFPSYFLRIHGASRFPRDHEGRSSRCRPDETERFATSEHDSARYAFASGAFNCDVPIAIAFDCLRQAGFLQTKRTQNESMSPGPSSPASESPSSISLACQGKTPFRR